MKDCFPFFSFFFYSLFLSFCLLGYFCFEGVGGGGGWGRALCFLTLYIYLLCSLNRLYTFFSLYLLCFLTSQFHCTCFSLLLFFFLFWLPFCFIFNFFYCCCCCLVFVFFPPIFSRPVLLSYLPSSLYLLSYLPPSVYPICFCFLLLLLLLFFLPPILNVPVSFCCLSSLLYVLVFWHPLFIVPATLSVILSLSKLFCADVFCHFGARGSKSGWPSTCVRKRPP